LTQSTFKHTYLPVKLMSKQLMCIEMSLYSWIWWISIKRLYVKPTCARLLNIIDILVKTKD